MKRPIGRTGSIRIRGAFGALIAAFSLACLATTDPTKTPLNILLITVDTLRADHLGAYGYDRKTSPALDKLASEGALFLNTRVPRGITWPSLTSIMTSLHPRTHGVRVNGQQLDSRFETIANVLRNEGFATAAFVSNMTTAAHRGFADVRRFSKGDRDSKAVSQAISWLGTHSKERFFLWIHLLGPHDPYLPKARFAEKFDTGYAGPLDGSSATLRRIHEDKIDLTSAELSHLVSLYDAKVAEVDERIGRLISRLDPLGLRDRTLVVVTSDHGDELYDHNHYILHSLSIHESVLRVPLLMRLPGVIPGGTVVDELVESIDIAPTLAGFVAVGVPAAFEGHDRRGWITGGGDNQPEGFSVAELGPYIHSIRSGPWHFIHNPQGFSSPRILADDAGDRKVFSIAREELYDVSKDPNERVNVAHQYPEVTDSLKRILRKWIESGESAYETAPEPSEETLDELRALGYVN